MANLKEIRNRITSVSSTKQITSAMKMVSAAKLKKAQDAITEMRPYSNKLQEILQNVSASLDNSEGIYSEERGLNKVLIVGITSNRGLCGGFNNNVIKKIKTLIDSEYKTSNVSILTVGKKVFDAFKRTDLVLTSDNLPFKPETIWDDLSFDRSSELAQFLMSQFLNKNYDKIVLVYNQFKNAAVQEVMGEQFLPVLPPVSEDNSSSVDYLYEPNKAFILNELIPKSLKTQFFKALLDSQASEHGARMTAMHKATDNASDLIDELKLSYNKARQAAITGEILEIVGGAEALNN
ncbi:MAG: ATP synthase F1 subunit gamma [Flavobacteriales bacterium]|nr:ATP synthase F1 subunit gamma [Flavobacteriales bacterium]